LPNSRGATLNLPNTPQPAIRPLRLGLGLVIAALPLLLDSPLHHHPELGDRPAKAAAVTLLMAFWWLTEALPIYWTSLVPIVAFPLLGVFGKGFFGDLRAAIAPYFDPYIFLFAGGMAIAAAMQQWDLHRRLALSIMAKIGTDPRRLLGGVLCATAFISLWLSNTATAAMMFPIGMALIAQLEHQNQGRRLAHYGMALMLAIAYGANLGGVGSKIGTAPNSQLAGFLEKLGQPISFLEFMAVGLPFVVVILPIAWLMLWHLGSRDQLAGDATEVVAQELAALGRVKRAEHIVMAVFAVTALLWITSKWLTDLLTGVELDFKVTSALVEAGIAVLAALVLLAWRTRGRQVLELGALKHVPWETLLLLGGGFAMAAGVQKSGLSALMGAQLSAVAGLPGLGQTTLASLVTVTISAVASNTSTIAIMLVVLKDAVAPAMLTSVLFAATIASSCDFALPVGTPPNAIVFGSGYVRIPTMAKYGVILDLVAALWAGFWCWLIVPWVLP
jgi:solute carrier family 13 (sodium-dependent dicarboxylate transporter), member 2/3/5